MGILAWLILLAWAAALATTVQLSFFRNDRRPTDYDWVYTAGGALLGGFTAQAWYGGSGVMIDGLGIVQVLGGGLFGGLLVELIYRFVIRRRQIA